MSKIIHSGRFLGTLLRTLANSLIKVEVPLANHFLEPLATMALASAIVCANQTKIRRKGVIKAEKGIAVVILNEDMNDIIRIIKSPENSGMLIKELV